MSVDPGGLRLRLTNAHGEWVDLEALGAAIVGIGVRDRSGTIGDVAMRLGGSAGCTIGRYANRIANGRFTLDGRTYRLATNENGNTLHGGPDGFSKRTWRVVGNSGAVATFALTSPDGDQGFPGRLECRVTYAFDASATLRIHYTATTDAPTVLNLTNHVYLNLSAGASASIASHFTRIDASAYTPVDAALIPTGAIAPVESTAYDFRIRRAIGPERVDVNLALDDWTGELRAVAWLDHPQSGRTLELATDQPGVQLFTGKPEGVALETQHFPDAPNHPNFRSTVLRPGQTFSSTTSLRFAAR